jgi:hypothetical protein
MADDEAAAIEEARRHGAAEPLRLARWVDALLCERRELRGQLDLIRKRLTDAAAYLDRLFIRPTPSRRRRDEH